ncbi:hypothetical protein Tco_0350392 [Tanacetum coccineum]
MLKKGLCSKSENTKASNVIKFYSDSSSDDHGSVFRGKPGSTLKGVGAPKHSRGKKKQRQQEDGLALAFVGVPEVCEAFVHQLTFAPAA